MVVEKEKEKEVTEKGSSTLALDEGRVASPALFVEEVTPSTKKRKTGDKGKEKVGAKRGTKRKTSTPVLPKKASIVPVGLRAIVFLLQS